MPVCRRPCALSSVICYITKNKKELLGASVSHAHGEALLHVTSYLSKVTIEVALVTLKRRLD